MILFPLEDGSQNKNKQSKQKIIVNNLNTNWSKQYPNTIIFTIILLSGLVLYFIYEEFKKDINNDHVTENIKNNSKNKSIIENNIDNNNDNNTKIEFTGNENSEKELEEKLFSDETILNFINSYYNDTEKDNFDANNYFSEKVKTFFTKKNITPAEINELFKNENEFLNKSSKIIENKIYYIKTIGEVSIYEFWIDFSCYRKSKGKYEKCKVKVQLEIDLKLKIKSYKEVESLDLKFILPSENDSNFQINY